VFGVSPRIVCVARDPLPRDSVVEEVDAPTSREDALATLRAELGAEVEEAGEAGEAP